MAGNVTYPILKGALRKLNSVSSGRFHLRYLRKGRRRIYRLDYEINGLVKFVVSGHSRFVMETMENILKEKAAEL